MARYQSKWLQGYFKTPESEVARISQVLGLNPFTQVPADNAAGYVHLYQGVHRLLDPCCGTGEALSLLAQQLANRGAERRWATRRGDVNYTTYGVEVNQPRAMAARQNIKYVLNSDFAGTIIGREMASVLFLNPPYDEDDDYRRLEHSFLVRSTPHLAKEGALVYIIPRRRLEVSAAFLAENYSDIHYWTFREGTYERFGQMVLVARRNPIGPDPRPEKRVERNDARDKMIEWSYGTDVCDIPMLDDYMFINARSVPTDKGGKPVPALFGRMRFNADAVYQQVSQSGYLQGAEFRERIWPEQETVECRPLMPLLNQHVSMTIMGGMFNSKPIRLGDKYLLLKGATSKVKDSFTEANGDDGVKHVEAERPIGSIVALDLEAGEFTKYA